MLRLEPQVGRASLRVSKCGTNNSNRPSQDFKEESGKASWPGPEHGPEGLALLDTAEEDKTCSPNCTGRLAIAPGGPARREGKCSRARCRTAPRSMQLKALAKSSFTSTLCVAVNPSTSGVDGLLSARRNGNSNLRWPEKVTSTFSHSLEQTLASQTAEEFPNGHWSQSTPRLGHCDEAGSSKQGRRQDKRRTGQASSREPLAAPAVRQTNLGGRRQAGVGLAKRRAPHTSPRQGELHKPCGRSPCGRSPPEQGFRQGRHAPRPRGPREAAGPG